MFDNNGRLCPNTADLQVSRNFYESRLMNIAKFAAALRILGLSLGVIAATASLTATAAYAQNSDEERPNSQAKPKKGGDGKVSSEFKIDPEKQKKGIADAPAIVASAKIACDPVNGYPLGATEYTKPDNTKVKGTVYEIACKTGPGFMLTVVSPTEVYQPFTCTLAAKIQQSKPDSIVCVLPENKPHYKWLTPVVQPFVPGCDVSNARVIGSTSTAPLIDRYEVACGAKAGGIVDYAQLGQTAQTEFKACILQEGTSSACTFTTKEQMAEPLKPLAATADAKCQVNNVRFVGVTTEGNGIYYEFGCSNQPGFIVRAKLTDNTFDRMVPCSAAAALGGCTFTNSADAAAGANGDYSSILKKAGYTCTVAEFNVIGTQESTKRDYVEFKCPEQPWGLVGFVPQPGSTAGVSVTDCFLVKTRNRTCSITTDDMLKTQLDKLIKLAEPKKGCDIKEVKYLGESAGVQGGLIAEIACVNKRGYIVVVEKDRNSISLATPCHIAKAHNDPQQCTIAGNGTYLAND